MKPVYVCVRVQDVRGRLDESIQTERHCSLVLNQCSETLDTMQKEMLMSSCKKDQKSKMVTLKVRMHMNVNLVEIEPTVRLQSLV